LDEGGNPDAEGRALAATGAVHRDGAAVEAGELLHDGQTEAEPSVFPRQAAVSLAETIEHVWKKIRLDADAVVRHADFVGGVDRSQRDCDVATGAGELDGV